ncbi:MAG: Gfo/Idh/MocA family oxidoreductase [Deltaproteobacteria bacterium]|nr:Gfo/Idh/MocA family oxidoreductase [Deltaproteobacteria bacterium]
MGFGNVAVEGHLPAWRQHKLFNIVAVCDPSETRLALAADALPAARRYATIDELLLNERLDFVDVATPPASHAAIALAALAKRVAVLSEKPLATRWDDLRRIRTAARAARAVVFTAHNWKYAPIIRTAKRTLRRGDIGTVSHVRLETIRSAPPTDAGTDRTWRLDPATAGGGILVDHGWHAFYLARHLADADPIAISAVTSQRKFTTAGVEDTAECTIEFPNARAEIFLTWAGDTRRNSGTVTGALGALTIADGSLITALGGRPPVETRFAQPLSAGSYHPDWFATMLDDFHAEVSDPAVRGDNLREAEACGRLLERAYQSSASGGARVALEDAPPPTAGSDAAAGG